MVWAPTFAVNPSNHERDDLGVFKDSLSPRNAQGKVFQSTTKPNAICHFPVILERRPTPK